MKKKVKGKLSFFGKLLLYINCGLSLALLISYLAPVTDPRTFWVVAFFGLAYPPLLFANVIMIVCWLIRKSKWALLSLITIAIGWNVLLNNIGFSLSGDEKTAPAVNGIRIMTYNVHNFKKFGDKKDISTKHEILEIINQQQPDVIGIQEFYTRKRGQYAMIDSIKKLTGANNCYFEIFMSNADEAMGMVVFSKFPIVSKGFIQLTEPGGGNQCIYVDLKQNNHIVRVYSMHLQSINFEPKDYKYLDTVSKSGKADLSSTRRLGSKLKRAFLKRSEQVLKIKAHARQCPYPYIISGDFNDTPSSYAVNQMAKGLKNAFREKGSGLGRTYNGDFPNYQIDYIMASPQFDVLGYNIVQKKLSDHYPVCTSLVLKQVD